MTNLWDIHCHVVPGVDDGAKTFEMALAILKQEQAQGISNIIVTPHYRRGMFETSRDKIEERFLILQETAATKFPEITLYLGCELHVNLDMEELARQDVRYCMAGSRYILTEFSGGENADNVVMRCRRLLNNGYIPIVAHIERIAAARKHLGLCRELKDLGAYLQVNADAFSGREGWGIRRFCQVLVRKGYADFIASDAHDPVHRACHMADAIRITRKKYGDETTERIFTDNPLSVVQNDILS